MDTPKSQFIACAFRDTDARTYTYKNDGEPVSIGDVVEVDTQHGKKTVTVSEDNVTLRTRVIGGAS